MSEHQCEHRPDSIPAVSVLRHLTRSSYCATNDNGLTAVISLHQTTIIFSAVQCSHRDKLQHCSQNQRQAATSAVRYRPMKCRVQIHVSIQQHLHYSQSRIFEETREPCFQHELHNVRTPETTQHYSTTM